MLKYGYMPNQIDHINHNRLDNRIVNLRSVSNINNTLNCSLSKNNRSGFTGVTWDKPRNVWTSRIMVHGKNLYLGSF